MGVSRSTAAMVMLMTQCNPQLGEERIFGQLLELRRQAMAFLASPVHAGSTCIWPSSKRMKALAKLAAARPVPRMLPRDRFVVLRESAMVMLLSGLG
jgi:hypothetical protein